MTRLRASGFMTRLTASGFMTAGQTRSHRPTHSASSMAGLSTGGYVPTVEGPREAAAGGPDACVEEQKLQGFAQSYVDRLRGLKRAPVMVTEAASHCFGDAFASRAWAFPAAEETTAEGTVVRWCENFECDEKLRRCSLNFDLVEGFGETLCVETEMGRKNRALSSAPYAVITIDNLIASLSAGVSSVLFWWLSDYEWSDERWGWLTWWPDDRGQKRAPSMARPSFVAWKMFGSLPVGSRLWRYERANGVAPAVAGVQHGSRFFLLLSNSASGPSPLRSLFLPERVEAGHFSFFPTEDPPGFVRVGADRRTVFVSLQPNSCALLEFTVLVG
uniref:Uncharacterized protein n=1 Tax=Chromera velia CCMP2878 TaxID=1169474 RepID=A0A0G4GM38_9ALVE|eukprot:Cvel_4897.t1-p1 / transcript=Cvel_4897.t1 / gene=Cvel_4897 / organism=Chromera_velia_CCMP2878 / gene_product=hypothetical protein / transcript_product=hypothetical protein / location=Cvel_scaffold221:3681-6126(-) / protein_length=330 / sequence_SO=supercontig / SO=protein_coding / is_pseudo=false